MKYPLAKPSLGKEEERAVLEVLRSRVLSMGPKVEAFEKDFAKFVGTKYAVAVSSGTAGLHLALIGAGIKEGDEVITTPFSFVASANAILYVGAKPVFVDIEPVTYNIDPDKIEATITSKTKAILVVHILGQATDMDPIQRLAKKYNLKIIEDACESVGATYKGKRVGTFGESAVFAFYPNKQMTTGEGGMMVTNSRTPATLFRSLRNQGRGEDTVWLDHQRLGYNYRMDEMSAALGIVQLRKIDRFIAERRQIAEWYEKYLSLYSEQVRTPRTLHGNTHTWFVYVALLLRGKRDDVIKRLGKKGIAAKPYFPSIHLFSFHQKRFGFTKGDFPISEGVSAQSLALPFYSGLTEKDVQFICGTLVNVLS